MSDNTNVDRTTRAYWIDLAVRFNIPIRCVYFTADPKICEHNDKVRALNLEVCICGSLSDGLELFVRGEERMALVNDV
jgi:predicted kinase